MNKRLALSALSVASMAAASASSVEAQVYQDLRGQVVGLSGVLSYTLVTSGVITTSVGGTTTLTPASGVSFAWNTTGPADDSMLTANVPLPSIPISGTTLLLPTLSSAGSFNENTGVLNEYAQLPGAVGVTLTYDGIAISITITNPNISFVGQAINAPTTAANTAVITNTTSPDLMDSGITINVFGETTLITIQTLIAQLTTWTMTAVPGPDSLAVFLPGMTLGGLAIARRRRRQCDRN